MNSLPYCLLTGNRNFCWLNITFLFSGTNNITEICCGTCEGQKIDNCPQCENPGSFLSFFISFFFFPPFAFSFYLCIKFFSLSLQWFSWLLLIHPQYWSTSISENGFKEKRKHKTKDEKLKLKFYEKCNIWWFLIFVL